MRRILHCRLNDSRVSGVLLHGFVSTLPDRSILGTPLGVVAEFCTGPQISILRIRRVPPRLTWQNPRHGIEQRLGEQLDEPNLAFCLQRRIGTCNHRHGQLEVRLQRRLYRPFLEQHRRPMLRHVNRPGLSPSAPNINSLKSTRLTGLEISAHLMIA